jgi:ring-1,2-phenylacetyl-CoA epoxidase subunit PaaE
MSALHFHCLFIKHIQPLTAQSVAITFAVPPDLRDAFEFTPGQFVTLRAMVDGASVRRSYSLCSTPEQLANAQEITVGIKRIEGGVFSHFATTVLQAGDELDVMPPQGHFSPHSALAAAGAHRLGIAAGSGITPLLSIMAHTLATDSSTRFTLIYGNQSQDTVMFHAQLQTLKTRYAERLSLVYVMSRQAQGTALLQGRLDTAKLAALLDQAVLTGQITEAFLCGPEAVITASQEALAQAGVVQERVHVERFAAPATKNIAANSIKLSRESLKNLQISLEIIIDGAAYQLSMDADITVLQAALNAGLDAPYACKAGVCATCSAKLLEGQVTMQNNTVLAPSQVAKGYVLTCQAQAVSERVVVSYDER